MVWNTLEMPDGKRLYGPGIGNTAEFIKTVDDNHVFDATEHGGLKISGPPFKKDVTLWTTFHDFNDWLAENQQYGKNAAISVFRTKEEAVQYLVDTFYPVIRERLEEIIYDHDFQIYISDDRLDEIDNYALIGDPIEEDYTQAAKLKDLPSPFNKESMYDFLYKYGYLRYENTEEDEVFWFVKPIKFIGEL